MANKTLIAKHSECQAGLQQLHQATGAARGQLAGLRAELEKLETEAAGETNHNRQAQRVGELRLEVRRKEDGLEEMRRQWCSLAEEEIALRYGVLEKQLAHGTEAVGKLQQEEAPLLKKLAEAEARRAEAEARKATAEERQRQVLPGALQRYLRDAVRTAGYRVGAERREAEQRGEQLEHVRSRLAAAQGRTAACQAKLAEVLALSRSHLRELNGSPAEIRAALKSPYCCVGRVAIEKVLAEWEAGFKEVRLHDPTYTITYHVKQGRIYYWADTGAVAMQLVLRCESEGGRRWPGETSAAVLSGNAVRRQLEEVRGAMQQAERQAQTVSSP
jgi:hypothetical protein